MTHRHDNGGPARQPSSIHGILNINKPYGMTSMDVVRTIKRISRQKRVGHGGTLDPFATGVVLLCIGQATRMMEHLINGVKEYRAQIALGVETDTYDVLGTVTSRQDPSGVTRADVEAALESFKGEIKQVPPMYSALKKEGKRLYDLARAGIEVEREARNVEVRSIQILKWTPPMVTVDVSCGRGFYMRSLAFDVGRELGVGAHLRNLERCRSGAFKISEATSLDDAESMYEADGWETALHAPDTAVRQLKAIVVGDQATQMIKNGRPLPQGLRVPEARPGELCRLYGVDGRFLAIMSFNGTLRQWQPHRVFDIPTSG